MAWCSWWCSATQATRTPPWRASSPSWCAWTRCQVSGCFTFKNTILFWGELGFLISSDWRGIIKSEQTQTVRRIRAGTLFSQFQNIAYVASQNETFVVLLSSQIFSMTRHQTESFTCPGTRWLYFHLMPLILLTTHPTYRKMTRGGICWNRRSNNAEKVMLCII